MNKTADFLIGIRQMMKLHDGMLKEISVKYNLTILEATVITFLHNNPDMDTAAEIVEYRMLSKGNVSQAVEQLIQNNYLKRNPDDKDRRKVHLQLLPSCKELISEIDEMQNRFDEIICSGIPEESLRKYEEVHQMMAANIIHANEE